MRRRGTQKRLSEVQRTAPTKLALNTSLSRRHAGTTRRLIRRERDHTEHTLKADRLGDTQIRNKSMLREEQQTVLMEFPWT